LADVRAWPAVRQVVARLLVPRSPVPRSVLPSAQQPRASVPRLVQRVPASAQRQARVAAQAWDRQRAVPRECAEVLVLVVCLEPVQDPARAVAWPPAGLEKRVSARSRSASRRHRAAGS